MGAEDTEVDATVPEPRRPRIITVFNQKGGVGKTTTSVNVAVCLAAFGRRVVLVDLDSQSNATTNLGVTPPVATGAYHLITGRAPFSECVRRTPYDGLRLVGGSDELAWADIELAMGEGPEAGLVRALKQVPDDIDVIVIDCPPAPGVVSVNALIVADAVVMPVMPSPHALDGLHKAWWNVNRVRTRYNQDLTGLNILLTMTEEGELTKRLTEDIIAEFGARVMPILVPRDHVVIEAAARDLPVAVMASGSPPARAYVRVAELLLGRGGGEEAGNVNARDAAREILDGWHKGEVPKTAHIATRSPPGPQPQPTWTDRAEADEQEGAAELLLATGPTRAVGKALLWLTLGAIMGIAATLAVLLGPQLPFPV
jgi:chromosome partitioning protein